MTNEELMYDLSLRSSFLSERTLHDPSRAVPSAYVDKINALKQKLSTATPRARSYLEKIESTVGYVPEQTDSTLNWYNFIVACTNDAAANDKSGTDEQHPFYIALSPFINAFERNVRNFLATKKIPYEDGIIDDARDALHQDLLELAGLTLYCQVKDECPALNKNQYFDWCLDYSARRWIPTVQEYPVLGRYIYDRFHQLFDSFCEMMKRLQQDGVLLCASGLLTNATPTLSRITFSLSDRHNNARRVCKLAFTNSPNLMYKPKALRNEAWLQTLVSDANINKDDILGGIKVVDRKTYGWAEDIFKNNAHNAPQSVDDAKRGYARVAALAYLINASDLHAENVVIKDNGIFIIDAETIFCFPGLKDDGVCDSDWRNFSIMNSEMFRSALEQNFQILEKAGVFTESLESPVPLYFFKKCDSEGVKIVIVGKSGEKPSAHFGDTSINEGGSANILCSSFETEAERLAPLLRQPDIFESIGDLECRLVARPTVSYARLLQRLYHPNFLKDAAMLSLEALGLMTTLPRKNNAFSDKWLSIIVDEIRQIENGDIPYFYYHPKSTAVYSKQGLVHPDLFSISPLAFFTAKISAVSAYEIKEQSAVIESSILAQKKKKTNSALLPYAVDNLSIPDKNNILDACHYLADDIIRHAHFRPHSKARWIGFNHDEAKSLLDPVSGMEDYYGGYWGIMVFLAATEQNLIRHSKPCADLTDFNDRQAAYWMQHYAANSSFFIASLGLDDFGGKLKAAFLLVNMDSARWGFLKDKLAQDIDALCREPITDDNLFDYYAGPVSLISTLMTIEESGCLDDMRHDRICEIIDTIARKLIENFDSHADNNKPEQSNLVGFAHGNAGLIFGLSTLYTRKQDKGLTAMMSRLLDYDDTCKSEDGRSWFDNREKDNKTRTVNRSWCHGLAGIGLSRLHMMSVPGLAERAKHDLNIVLTTLSEETVKQQYDFLCCGESGEIDFLLEASRHDDYMFCRSLVDKKVANLTYSIISNRQFDGLLTETSGKNYPGLFQGASGIGYTLLRSIDPNLRSLTI